MRSVSKKRVEKIDLAMIYVGKRSEFGECEWRIDGLISVSNEL